MISCGCISEDITENQTTSTSYIAIAILQYLATGQNKGLYTNRCKCLMLTSIMHDN